MIIKLPGRHIVVNGGEPLDGCPTSWDDAWAWIDAVNKGREEYHLRWQYDCGFKLDFDGPLIRVSSRFYPPKSSYGPTWDGAVRISVFDMTADGFYKKVEEKEFDCQTLDELRQQVEDYIGGVAKRIQACFTEAKG